MGKPIQMSLNEREIVKYQKLNESESGKLFDGVLCRVKYPIYWFGQLNRNNRMYEEQIMDKLEGDKDIKEAIEKRSSFMQEEHPLLDNKTRTAHIAGVLVGFTRESIDGKKAGFAVMDVLDTPMGRIVDTLIKANCGIGTSTRADGAVEECMDEGTRKAYHKVITESYKFFALDFTAEPSTYGSYPQDVQRSVVDIVKESVGSGKLDRETALHLLESLNAPEATKLNETIKLCTGKCEGGCSRVATGVCKCSEEKKDIDAKFLYSIAHKPEYNKGTWWYNLTTGEIQVGKDSASAHNDEEFKDIAHKPGWINGRVFSWNNKNILIVYYPKDNVTSTVLLDLDKKLENELGLKIDHAINQKGEDISHLLESLISRTNIKVREDAEQSAQVQKIVKDIVSNYKEITGQEIKDMISKSGKFNDSVVDAWEDTKEYIKKTYNIEDDSVLDIIAKDLDTALTARIKNESKVNEEDIVKPSLSAGEKVKTPKGVGIVVFVGRFDSYVKVDGKQYEFKNKELIKESKANEDINIKVGDMVEVLDSGAVAAPASKVTNTKETLNANGTKTVLVQTEKGGETWFDSTKVKLNKFNEGIGESKLNEERYKEIARDLNSALQRIDMASAAAPRLRGLRDELGKAFADIEGYVHKALSRLADAEEYVEEKNESKLNEEDEDKALMNKLFKDAHAYFDKMKIQPTEDDIMDYVIQGYAEAKGTNYDKAASFVERYCSYEDEEECAESFKKGDKLEMNVHGKTVKAVALDDSHKIGQVEVVKIAQEGNKEPVTVMVGRVKKLGESALNEAKFLLWDKAAMKVLTKKNGSVLEFSSTMEARKHVEDLLGELERYEILARTNTSPVQREAAMVGSRETKLTEEEGRYKNNPAGDKEFVKKTGGRFSEPDDKNNPDTVKGNESKEAKVNEAEKKDRIDELWKLVDNFSHGNPSSLVDLTRLSDFVEVARKKGFKDKEICLALTHYFNRDLLRGAQLGLESCPEESRLHEGFNFDKDLDKFMSIIKGLISEDEVKSLSESKSISEGVSDLLAKRKHAQAIIEAERDKAIEIVTLYETIIGAQEKALKEAKNEVNYEELAKDLQPKTKEVFVKFMNARWPDSGPKYDIGYAETWLERFKRGEEWEFSDSQSRDVLKGLGDYAKKEEGVRESEKKALITKVHEELNKVFSTKLAEQKESFEKQTKALNESHANEIFQRTIVDRKIEKSGLTLPEPVVALLREAKSEEQVNSIIGRYRLNLNEALLHSGKPQGMTVTVNEPGKPTDSVMQASLDETKKTLKFMK